MNRKASDSEIQILTQFFVLHSELTVCRRDIEEAYEILKEVYSGHQKVLVCGNGGSAADAEHIVGELMKGFIKKRPLSGAEKKRISQADPERGEGLAEKLQGVLPAISLNGHPSLASAFSNDVDPQMVFAQQLYGLGSRDDAFIGLSTSGNSKNIINALIVARAMKLKTIGFSGREGGEMKELCDICIRVPSSETYRVQEYHLPIYHLICRLLEEYFFTP